MHPSHDRRSSHFNPLLSQVGQLAATGLHAAAGVVKKPVRTKLASVKSFQSPHICSNQTKNCIGNLAARLALSLWTMPHSKSCRSTNKYVNTCLPIKEKTWTVFKTLCYPSIYRLNNPVILKKNRCLAAGFSWSFELAHPWNLPEK